MEDLIRTDGILADSRGILTVIVRLSGASSVPGTYHVISGNALPIVRRTGGLADTVEQYNQDTGDGTGFLFDALTPGAVYDTVVHSVKLNGLLYLLIITLVREDRPRQYKASVGSVDI